MRKLKISYGRNRFEKKWKNGEIGIDDLFERYRTPIRTPETVAEYQKMSKTERNDIKDVGGCVLGHLREGRRKKDYVACRSAILLDADHADTGFSERHKERFRHRSCLYSTHSHMPETPRLREVIPLSRDVTPEEYGALARYVAAEQGIDYFDDTTYEPERLMHNPSCPTNGEYVYIVTDGPLLNPDDYFAKHPEWRDCSQLPHSSRQSEVIQHELKHQADPLEKSGIVGAFCRAYGIEEVIAAYLPEVYAPSAYEDRYDYIPGTSSAGVVIYDDKFARSYHATDPASGKLLNAFDLVRQHRFGDLEEKASYNAMAELAVKDQRVSEILLEDRRALAAAEFAEGEDWTRALARDKAGSVINSLRNIRLILENDPNLKALVFNQLADGMEIKGEVPWKHPARFWRDADDAQLISYIDANYGTFSARNYGIAVTKVADDRSYHPVREYLEALPPWDGVPRAETLLIDYLGADDNPYVRAVTRKTLCAAVTRVFRPGVKFDNILVLNGAQGIGKSTLIARLGGDWYSDSLALTDMNDKTAAEKLQGYWLHEIGELAGMRKADIDKVKAFISRQDDKYRASFGRRVTPHPRQCVFFGTTNSEKGYLRDITGNRRFWTVKTPGGGKKRAWQLTNEDVSQIWAETLVYYHDGERLYLDAHLEALARGEQRDAMEHDEREGLVRNYLDRLLPSDWDAWDIHKRRDYIAEPDDPTLPEGTVKRQTVSNMEIWCECFGKRKEDILPKDSYAIAAIMERISLWEKADERPTLPLYGRQRVYRREDGDSPGLS